MTMLHPGINCYCHFCSNPLRFQIARAGESVNCFNCGMETVLFIPGLQAPYAEQLCALAVREIHWAKNEFGTRHLAGLLQNISTRHLNWVRIEFILYSRPDCPVGTTSDCLINVPPNRVWRFSAPLSQPEALHASEPLLSCEYGRVSPPRAPSAVNGSASLQKAQHIVRS